MGIWNLLGWEQHQALQEAMEDLEEVIAENGKLEVYDDDHDYFYEIYVAFNHTQICSIYYEWLTGDDSPTLHTNINNYHTKHYEVGDAVKHIIDYLKQENLIGRDSE